MAAVMQVGREVSVPSNSSTGTGSTITLYDLTGRADALAAAS
jgi:hypothetical protein